MSVAELPIRLDPEKIAQFCLERGIRKLSLFGSVLRHDFDPARSDVDVLVELRPDARPGFAYFGWEEELSKIMGRNVDLCSRLNKYIEDEVRREAMTIYEQA
jgi:predicted nucleotidyltransferase